MPQAKNKLTDYQTRFDYCHCHSNQWKPWVCSFIWKAICSLLMYLPS